MAAGQQRLLRGAAFGAVHEVDKPAEGGDGGQGGDWISEEEGGEGKDGAQDAADEGRGPRGEEEPDEGHLGIYPRPRLRAAMAR